MATVKIIPSIPITTGSIQETNFVNTTIIPGKRIASFEQILPFRVKFTATQIPAVGPGRVPPIPLQVIGYSNYIL